MRQAGIIAAAGLYALEHNVGRLAEDHDNAVRLARGLQEIEELSVDSSSIQTNMVYLEIGSASPQAIEEHLRQNDILIHEGKRIRLVTHLDVSESDIEDFARVTGDFNPVHLDEEYAKNTPLGTRIAHHAARAGCVGEGNRIEGTPR